MHGLNNRSASRLGDSNGDRLTTPGAGWPSALQMEAATLLTQPASREAFQSRVSTANTEPSLETQAHQMAAGDNAQRTNADTDQVSQMLTINPVSELFDALKERDRGMAVDFAVRNQEVQTHAMHTDDLAFSQEVKLRISGRV